MKGLIPLPLDHRERRILAEGETLSHLAVTSSLRALEMAGIEAQDLDLVLLATSSADDAFGSACQVRSYRSACVLLLTPKCRDLIGCMKYSNAWLSYLHGAETAQAMVQAQMMHLQYRSPCCNVFDSIWL